MSDRSPFRRVVDDLTGGDGCACHTGMGYNSSCVHCRPAQPVEPPSDAALRCSECGRTDTHYPKGPGDHGFIAARPDLDDLWAQLWDDLRRNATGKPSGEAIIARHRNSIEAAVVSDWRRLQEAHSDSRPVEARCPHCGKTVAVGQPHCGEMVADSRPVEGAQESAWEALAEALDAVGEVERLVAKSDFAQYADGDPRAARAKAALAVLEGNGWKLAQPNTAVPVEPTPTMTKTGFVQREFEAVGYIERDEVLWAALMSCDRCGERRIDCDCSEFTGSHTDQRLQQIGADLKDFEARSARALSTPDPSPSEKGNPIMDEETLRDQQAEIRYGGWASMEAARPSMEEATAGPPALSRFLHRHEGHELIFDSEHSEDGGDALNCADCNDDGPELSGLLHPQPDIAARPKENPVNADRNGASPFGRSSDEDWG